MGGGPEQATSPQAGHSAGLEKAAVQSSWLGPLGSLTSCSKHHLSGIPMEKAALHGALGSRGGGLWAYGAPARLWPPPTPHGMGAPTFCWLSSPAAHSWPSR